MRDPVEVAGSSRLSDFAIPRASGGPRRVVLGRNVGRRQECQTWSTEIETLPDETTRVREGGSVDRVRDGQAVGSMQIFAQSTDFSAEDESFESFWTIFAPRNDLHIASE